MSVNITGLMFLIIDNQRAHGNRYRKIDRKGCRLEANEVYANGACSIMRLTSFIFTGPGVGEKDAAPRPVDMNQDEEFTHETIALYDVNRGLLFAEKIENGITARQFASYLTSFTVPKEKLIATPVLDETASARARRGVAIRELMVGFALGPVTEEDKKTGLDVTKAYADGSGGELMEIRLSAKTRPTLSLDWAWSKVDQLLTSVGIVEKIKVRTVSDDGASAKWIDILNQDERRQAVLPVDALERRILFEVKRETIIRFWREYTNQV